MLSQVVVVNVTTNQTAVKTHNHILSVVQAHKHMPGETYKIYGDNSHKFSLDHFNNNEVFLQFNHKVTKSRVFKLILLIADESKLENLTLLPVEVRVYAQNISELLYLQISSVSLYQNILVACMSITLQSFTTSEPNFYAKIMHAIVAKNFTFQFFIQISLDFLLKSHSKQLHVLFENSGLLWWMQQYHFVTNFFQSLVNPIFPPPVIFIIIFICRNLAEIVRINYL